MIYKINKVMSKISEQWKIAKLEIEKQSKRIEDGGLSFDEQIEALILHEMAIKKFNKIDREYKNYLGIDLK